MDLLSGLREKKPSRARFFGYTMKAPAREPNQKQSSEFRHVLNQKRTSFKNDGKW